MLQVQDLSYTFNKDNIVNYERKLIESPFESLPKPVARHESKYSVCQLYSKVQELVGDAPYNLRWIGNAPNSAISAYIYSLLMLSVANTKNLMMFKSAFYELCRKYLDVKEQKLLIQFLCLLQFSSDKYLFLKKYPLIDSIIFSVFKKLQAEENYFHEQERDSSQQITDSSRFSNEGRVSRSINLEMEDSNTGQLFQMNKLAELYYKFGLKFHFLKWTKSSESSFLLTIDESRKMYIIIEREYFFILQMLEKAQIKPKKSKLSKGDRIQVERLLSYSHTESQLNFQQKINYNSEYAVKDCVKFKQDPYNTHHTVDSESNKKDILVCNPNNHIAPQVTVNPKKQYKFSYFTKKVNSKVQEIHQSIIKPKESPKKQEYIDLMESSFQEQQIQQVDRMRVNKQIQESHSLKFYTPKFLVKPLNSPAQSKKKKNSFDQKANKTQTFAKRGFSPSEAEKKYVTTINREKNIKFQKSKEIKFQSPPRLFNNESPDKKNANKNEIEQKKAHDTQMNEKRKEEPKYVDKKYIEKKEQIHKNHMQKDPKNSENSNINKIKTCFSQNFKIFNNRISLQSRKDLDLLAKYKLPTQDLVLNQISEVDRSAQVSRRQLFEKKKIIREELAQSLNNKSEVLLKKTLFEHLETKFAGENLSFIPKTDQKFNKSLESKQENQRSEIQKIRNHQNGKEKKFQTQKECPQSFNENKLNGGFEIRIKYADREQVPRSQ